MGYEAEKIKQERVKKALDGVHADLRNILGKSLQEFGAKHNLPGEIVNTVTERFEAICNVFLPHFATADFLALKYQSYYTLGSKMIYILSALAVIAMAAQAIFSSLPQEIILLEIAAISAILLIIKFGNHLGWHRRWLDYRMLTERFRFAVFMAMAGERASVKSLRYELYDSAKNGDWIFSHFSDVWAQWEGLRLRGPGDRIHLDILKRFISVAWFDDQKKYHLKNVAKHLGKHRRYSLAGETLFFLTLVAALLHYLGAGGHELGAYLTFLAITFPAAGSASSALRSHFEHNRLARRSQKIAVYLEAMDIRLQKVTTEEELLDIVREAEALMLNENSEWYVMIGFHGLATPA